jgi:mercuric ion transport protein
MHPARMTIKTDSRASGSVSGQGLIAAAGLLGAVAASSCCILPLVLFGAGVSGAWIGNLTRLAPYQPCFIAATIGFLGCGYWLAYRSSKSACAEGETCARPLPNRLIKVGLVLATALVVIALGFDFVARFLLDS